MNVKVICKKPATAAPAYVFMFALFLICTIVVVYLAQIASAMTQQHSIDDALSDATLACLVADDVYYFETLNAENGPVIRFKDVDNSYEIYKSCMEKEISQVSGFFKDIKYTGLILYEVKDDKVTVTRFLGNSGIKSSYTRALGSVKTPDGDTVKETSAYAKVEFNYV